MLFLDVKLSARQRRQARREIQRTPSNHRADPRVGLREVKRKSLVTFFTSSAARRDPDEELAGAEGGAFTAFAVDAAGALAENSLGLQREISRHAITR